MRNFWKFINVGLNFNENDPQSNKISKSYA